MPGQVFWGSDPTDLHVFLGFFLGIEENVVMNVNDLWNGTVNARVSLGHGGGCVSKA